MCVCLNLMLLKLISLILLFLLGILERCDFLTTTNSYCVFLVLCLIWSCVYHSSDDIPHIIIICAMCESLIFVFFAENIHNIFEEWMRVGKRLRERESNGICRSESPAETLFSKWSTQTLSAHATVDTSRNFCFWMWSKPSCWTKIVFVAHMWW